MPSLDGGSAEHLRQEDHEETQSGREQCPEEALPLEVAQTGNGHDFKRQFVDVGNLCSGHAKPLEGLGAKYSVDALTGFFLSPTPPMPAFELPEEERRALAVHLLSRFE